MWRHSRCVYPGVWCFLLATGFAVSQETAPIVRLRMDVQLAMIPVHVTSAAGGPVMGLNRGNFRLFEDGVEQKITYFVNEDSPLSVGFLLDTSQSMKDKIQKSLAATRQFLKANLPDDEFFLVEFNEHPHLTVPFARDPEQLYYRLARAKPLGRTSLLDAIAMSLTEEKRARNPRKAMVILSDGGDNHSRFKERDVRRAVREADVQIYAMGIFAPDGDKHSTEEQDGPRLLRSLAEDTGGRHFPVDRIEDLSAVCARVDTELRNQYTLGYSPQSRPQDGRYHTVKVMLDNSGDAKSMHMQYRPGYFAPRE
jgi:Ca-activated chloride channel family protein